MKTIIEVKNLQKFFYLNKHHRGGMGALRNLFTRQRVTVRAVDGISFRIRQGELVGYLGPNGAGKSTTLKMLTGLLVPTAGELHVNDFVPWRERKNYVSRIGAVFGQRTSLWWDLPVIESLDLLQHIYRIPERVFTRNMDEFRSLLNLDDFINTPVRSLSLGQRMRAELCAALLHDPDLLFLDEPTIGLDVVAKERIRQFIRHINQERRTTVILTTHDISDVEKLCQRVMIIDRGRLLFDGDLSYLRDQFGGKRQLLVEFSQEYPQVSVDGADLLSYQDQQAVYEFSRDAITASELIGRISALYRISDLQVREPDLEVTIRRIYEERLLDKKT